MTNDDIDMYTHVSISNLYLQLFARIAFKMHTCKDTHTYIYNDIYIYIYIHVLYIYICIHAYIHNIHVRTRIYKQIIFGS